MGTLVTLPILEPSAAPVARAAPVLPPLYAGWMESLLGDAIPDEPLSTCGNCAMARPSAETETAHAMRFRADAKCCTYLPTMWNFLTGGVLLDESSEAAPGRATVERRIDRATAVTPLGLRMSSTYELLYRSKLDSFGRNTAFRCPHYIDEAGGLCGVWRHRNSVCATYFCKLRRGAVGNEFWIRLRQLLGGVEESLAQWCLLELKVEPQVLRLLFPPSAAAAGAARDDLDGGPGMEQRVNLWGPRWVGHEREFYRECARLVGTLRWDDVLRVCGPTAMACAQLVDGAFCALGADTLADRLRLGKLTVVPLDDEPRENGVCYVSTYTFADMPKLPTQLLGLLPLFDGTRPTDEVVSRIREEAAIELTRADLLRLVDHGILRQISA